MKYLFILLLLLVLIGGGFAIYFVKPRGRRTRKYHFESTPARNLTTTELTIGSVIFAGVIGLIMAFGG